MGLTQHTVVPVYRKVIFLLFIDVLQVPNPPKSFLKRPNSTVNDRG